MERQPQGEHGERNSGGREPSRCGQFQVIRQDEEFQREGCA